MLVKNNSRPKETTLKARNNFKSLSTKILRRKLYSSNKWEEKRRRKKTMKAWNLKPGIISASAKSPHYPTFLLPANVLAEIWILAQSEDFASSQNFASGF